MKETKLLNCPFCGGDAVTAEMYNTKLKKLFPIVKCLDCECRTPMTETFEEAIKAWNTRKPMERILDELEEALKVHETQAVFSSDSERAYMKAIKIVKEEGGIE